jgi:hypothetical protein
MEAKVNLGLHYLLDVLIFDRAELLLRSLFFVNRCSSLKQLRRPKQGTKVFCFERRSLVQFGCHCRLKLPQLSLRTRFRYFDVKADDIEGIKDSGLNKCTLRTVFL